MNERRQQPLPGPSTGAGKGPIFRCALHKILLFFFVFFVLTHYEARNWINFLFIICLAVIAFIDVLVFFNLSTNIHDKRAWVLWYNYWAAGVAVSLRRGFIEPKGNSINDNFFKITITKKMNIVL